MLWKKLWKLYRRSGFKNDSTFDWSSMSFQRSSPEHAKVKDDSLSSSTSFDPQKNDIERMKAIQLFRLNAQKKQMSGEEMAWRLSNDDDKIQWSASAWASKRMRREESKDYFQESLPEMQPDPWPSKLRKISINNSILLKGPHFKKAIKGYSKVESSEEDSLVDQLHLPLAKKVSKVPTLYDCK